MIANWQIRKCGECMFKIDNQCRKNPPQSIIKHISVTTGDHGCSDHLAGFVEYIEVDNETPACSMFDKY